MESTGEPSLDEIRQSRRPLAFRLSLRSLDEMVNMLIPYYGQNCPIAVVTDDLARGTHIHATLGTITGVFDGMSAPRRPFLIIG